MAVNSRRNKELLWQLLSEHPSLKQNPKKFQSVLEYRVNDFHNNRFKFGNNLMQMNKEIIKLFAQEMPKATSKSPIEPQLSKAQVFESRLKAQETNFNTLINKPKPPDIDFSDKNEDTPITERMVDTTLQARAKELQTIMSQYKTGPSAEKWLKSEETSAHNIKIDKSSNVTIQPTVIESATSSRERRVHFDVDEPVKPLSLLDKLKKTDMGETILTALRRIEANQEKMLLFLDK